MFIIASICIAAAAVAGGVGLTGIAKGLAGACKALFFGFLAAAGLFAAIGLIAAKKLGG